MHSKNPRELYSELYLGAKNNWEKLLTEEKFLFPLVLVFKSATN